MNFKANSPFIFLTGKEIILEHFIGFLCLLHSFYFSRMCVLWKHYKSYSYVTWSVTSFPFSKCCDDAFCPTFLRHYWLTGHSAWYYPQGNTTPFQQALRTRHRAGHLLWLQNKLIRKWNYQRNMTNYLVGLDGRDYIV